MSDELLAGMYSAGAVEIRLGDAALMQRMLDVEAALASACAHAGLIPPDAAESITRMCRAELFDAADIGRRAVRHATPVVPLVADLRALVDPSSRAYVHFGATSQDIVDTAMCLLARDALGAILADLAAVAERLAELATAHTGAVQMGRTLLQRAEPITFGLVCAGWMTAVDQARADLSAVRDNRLAVQLGGPVGTREAYGLRGDDVARDMALALHLADPGLPWHTNRQPIGSLAAACAGAAAALATIARTVTLLSQHEIGELAEGSPGRSSAMPHKRNPARSVLVTACAHQVSWTAAGLASALTVEAQRSAGAWQAELPTVRNLLRFTGGATAHALALVTDLEVDPTRMRDNVGDVPVSDAMLASARSMVERAVNLREAP